jgi:hypothetical protein
MHKEKLNDCSLCLGFPCVFVRPVFNCATFYEFPMYVGKTSPGINPQPHIRYIGRSQLFCPLK